MTQPPQHSARHAARTERAKALTTPSAALKSVTGLGFVVGATALLAAPSATSAAPKEPTSQASASAQADTLLDARGDDPAAQRSTARVALAAPADLPAPMQQRALSAGALDVSAVAKPKPKPKPEPVEETTTQATDDQDQAAEPTQDTAEDTAQGTTEESTETTDGSTETASPQTQPAPSGGVNTSSFANEARAIGLGPNASAVYSAVRTQFPSMTNIGGYRAGDPGDHGSGRAVDIMVTGAPGDAVAAYLQQNAGRLNIKYLIWKQRYWQPGSDWRMMEDRGDPTQNHYDHVHVSVY